MEQGEKTFVLKLLVFLCVVSVLTVAFVATLRSSSALNQDLGRHLKLGEMIWKDKAVPKTNLFSYTNQDFPFINHHWLSEVVFYYLDESFGVNSISFLKIVLIVLSFVMVFLSAYRLSGVLPALFSSTLLAPFLLERIDERPEMFGFLFFTLMFLVLFSRDRPKKWQVLLMPLVILLWVNFHLSFVYGVFLLGIFVLRGIIRELKDSRGRMNLRELSFYGFVGAAGVLATLVNPNGLSGALYPFRIFSNFGYRIVENQTVFFLLSRIANPLIPYFLVVSLVVAAFILYVIYKEKRLLAQYLLFFVFTFLGFLAIRNLSFFTFVAIPAFAFALSKVYPGLREVGARGRGELLWKGGLVLFLTVVNVALSLFFVSRVQTHFGVVDMGKDGVDFILENNLPGRIFNNFDIGGYLDYRLYPKYQVFVDNRPEAFPADFFQLYIDVQQDPEIRREVFEEYGINSVVFSHTDLTPWAQDFLQQMLNDSGWEMVFVDDFLIVFARVGWRNEVT